MSNDKYTWFLIVAIMTEVTATMLLGLSGGMSKLLPTIGSLSAYVCSYYFLTLSLKKIPIGLAYALWAGIGIMANTLITVLLSGILPPPGSITGMMLIIAGALIINLLAKNENKNSAAAGGNKI